jgi:hypothetical protein
VETTIVQVLCSKTSDGSRKKISRTTPLALLIFGV